jgi:hypothetical protein
MSAPNCNKYTSDDFEEKAIETEEKGDKKKKKN